MSHRADPQFLPDLKKYGTVNIESCFNCGNCTAVCPLSTEDDNFPRRMIRYAQVGMRDKLLRSKELWLCYSCGECTATCPRQADPGEFMAAARRYAIAKYDRLGLARLLYTSSLFNASFLILLAAALGAFFYSFHGVMPGDTLQLFNFIPATLIHDAGVIAGLIVILTAISGVVSMAVHVSKQTAFTAGTHLDWLSALKETVAEVVGQKRYRRDCELYAEEQRWYAQRWFIHASMLWGFAGLFAATALDYLLELLGVKPTGTYVPIWYPVRLLGTIAGIMLMYGTTAAILKRLQKADEGSSHSTPSDWAFLILLWLGGLTGFALEVAIYLPQPYPWGYWMLLIHLVVVGELIILLPFTKFMHAIYRMLALYILALRPVAEAEREGAETADNTQTTRT
jgi:ferredoxin